MATKMCFKVNENKVFDLEVFKVTDCKSGQF